MYHDGHIVSVLQWLTIIADFQSFRGECVQDNGWAGLAIEKLTYCDDSLGKTCRVGFEDIYPRDNKPPDIRVT